MDRAQECLLENGVHFVLTWRGLETRINYIDVFKMVYVFEWFQEIFCVNANDNLDCECIV